MKKAFCQSKGLFDISVLIFLFSSMLLSAQQASDLFISEYCEGSGYNKYIEIYNGTGSAVDLSNYRIYKITNDGNWFENGFGDMDIHLEGTLQNDSVLVLAHSSADQIILEIADVTSGSANWNGNDAIGLFKNVNGIFQLIDVIGDEYLSGSGNFSVAGMNNISENHTIIRKSSISSPNSNWFRSAGFSISNTEWNIWNIDDFSDLGRHDMLNDLSETIVMQDFNVGGFGSWKCFSESSDTDWYIRNGSARISGHSQDETSEDWLISPSLNLNQYINEKMIFYTWWNYGNFNENDYLKLVYSTDYSGTGTPEDSEWHELPFSFNTDLSQYWSNSSIIDLTEISGSNVHIAFVYYSKKTHSPSYNSRTWNIDNIHISGDYFSSTGRTAFLEVRNILPEVPIAGLPFTIEVVSTDKNGVPVAVKEDATIKLVQIKGFETLNGNTEKVLEKGKYKVIFDDLIYPIAGEVQILPTSLNNPQIGSDKLTPKLCEFTVSSAPMLVINAFEKSHVGSIHPEITVEARHPDGSINTFYSGYDIALNIEGGAYSGIIKGLVKYGTATFSDIMFKDVASYSISGEAELLPDALTSIVEVNPAPEFEELIIPAYVKGDGTFPIGGGNGRIPSFALVRFHNLHPNTTYRFITGGIYPDDAFQIEDAGETLQWTSNNYGAGNNIHYDEESNSYKYNAEKDIADAGEYSTFITGEGESSKTFWINIVPTANSVFSPLEDGGAGTMKWIVDLAFDNGAFITRRATQSSSITLKLGEKYYQASGIFDIDARMTPKNKVVFRDNSGSVVTTAVVQDDGSALETDGFAPQSPDFYSIIENIPGAWATFVPNSYQGIFTIEEVDNSGNVVNTWNDDNGTWALVSTVGEGMPINFETPRLDIMQPEAAICASNQPYLLEWETHGVEEIDIQVSVNDGEYQTILTNIPARDDYYPWEIAREIYSSDEFTDRDISLQVISSEHTYINDLTNDFNIYDAPLIHDQSDDAVICADNAVNESDNISLGVIASGSFLSFQWYKDGKIIHGAQNSSYRISNAEFTDAGAYTCEVSSAVKACEAALSDKIDVYVAGESEITEQAVDKITSIGEFASFKIKAHVNGVEPDYHIDVQWFKKAIPVDIKLTDDDYYAGTRSSLLTISNIQPHHFGEYYAIVDGKCDFPDVKSDIATLKEIAIDISGPTDADVCEDETINLSINVLTDVED